MSSNIAFAMEIPVLSLKNINVNIEEEMKSLVFDMSCMKDNSCWVFDESISVL